MLMTDQLRNLAAGYTAAWGSQDAASVASFYSPDGSLSINDGPAAQGRAAIAEAAQGFMTDFPDLKVFMDGLSVVLGGAGLLGFALFLWNFYRSMNRLIVTVEALAETVVPLARSSAVQDILLALKKSNLTGQAVVEGLRRDHRGGEDVQHLLRVSDRSDSAPATKKCQQVSASKTSLRHLTEQTCPIEAEKLAREAGLVPADETLGARASPR